MKSLFTFILTFTSFSVFAASEGAKIMQKRFAEGVFPSRDFLLQNTFQCTAYYHYSDTPILITEPLNFIESNGLIQTIAPGTPGSRLISERSNEWVVETFELDNDYYYAYRAYRNKAKKNDLLIEIAHYNPLTNVGDKVREFFGKEILSPVSANASGYASCYFYCVPQLKEETQED